jgi:outer membrane receptor protein involved in Fe transport
MKKAKILGAAVVVAVPGFATESGEAKSDETTVSQLLDVEVVGVKQLPETDLDLSTVVKADEVKALNIRAMKGVSQIAPNFYMPTYGSAMTSSIYVRGLGARIDQPVIGLNVDNVPFLNKDGYDFDLPDVERIEILRGSRAVLNGRNAMGGQINIVTASPWSYQGIKLSAGYSRANTYKFSAGIYGRLSDHVASSLTGFYRSTDGFYRNEYDNSHSGRERQGGARWKLSWHPGSRWSLSNTAAFNVVRQNGYPYENITSGKIAYNDSMFYNRTAFSDGLTVSYTGKRMIATSITSVQYLDDNMTLDQDFLPLDYFTLTQKRREWAITQDLFAKGTRHKYDWLIGVFGFYRPSDMSAPVTFKDTGISRLIEDNVNAHLPSGMELKWDSRALTFGSDFDISNGGFALYHQSTVKLGGWTLQGGLRWDIERISMDYTSRCFSSASMYRQLPSGQSVNIGTREISIDDNGTLSQTFNQLLPQVAISYQTGLWTLVGSVAKGYKAGGYNVQMFSDVLQQRMMKEMGLDAAYDLDEMLSYKPEKSWNYELEARTHSANNRFSAEAVLFYIDCTDQQLTVFPQGNTTGRAMTNAGSTHSYGGELTLGWNIIDPLTVKASYGYTHATFAEYNNGIMDLKGKRLPYAPAQTMFVQASYQLPVTFWGFTPTLDLSTRGVGDIYWNDDNSEKQNFYATLNASLTFQHKLGSIMLWGENLTNTRYNTFYFQSIGNSFVQRADPWTVGITLRANIAL